MIGAGRRDLDSLLKWVVDAAESTPQNEAGERILMAVIQKGLTRLQEIVQRSNGALNSIGEEIRGIGDEYQALDSQNLGKRDGSGEPVTARAVDFKAGPATEPPPIMPGRPVDPADPFIGDQRFGHWEAVIAPPYTGSTPPPLTDQYRPFPGGTPLKTGGTTGWYTPGKSWVADEPYAQLQEEFRFRIAGTEATTYTRMVNENGAWQQERWVRNVYEYQRNTQMLFGGDVTFKGTDGDLGGIPAIPKIDHDWKPIALNQIATLSAQNTGTAYYLPDGCGGQFTYQGGVPIGGLSGLPPSPPIMTRPR